MKEMIKKWNTRFLTIESETITEEKQKQPLGWMWGTKWKLTLKKSNQQIGSIAVDSTSNEAVGSVFITIEEAYRGKGYAKEALSDFIPWLFAMNKKLVLLTVTLKEEDEAAKKLCSSLGYHLLEEQVYECKRPDPSYGILLMTACMAVGLCFGQVLDIVGVTTLIGGAVGLAAGLTIEVLLKKKVRKTIEAYHKSLDFMDENR